MSVYDKYDNYIGDVNLEHGGMFFNLDEWRYGYVSVLEVIDLGSATGFSGGFLVEHKVVMIGREDINKSALESCGWDKLPGRTSDSRKMALTEAVCRYGYCDPDDSWDNYRTGATSVYRYQEYVDTEDYSQDDWLVDGTIPDEVDLLDFLEDEGHLYDF